MPTEEYTYTFLNFTNILQSNFYSAGIKEQIKQNNRSLETLTEWFYTIRESNGTKRSPQEAQKTSQQGEKPARVLKMESTELSEDFPEKETAFQGLETDTQEQERKFPDALEDSTDFEVVIQGTKSEEDAESKEQARTLPKPSGDLIQVSVDDEEAKREADTQQMYVSC